MEIECKKKGEESVAELFKKGVCLVFICGEGVV